jgi:hypothetical protein
MSKKESKPSSKRRDALRKLAVTGGVIGTARTWTKPVVDSVVLPAHALTSNPLRDPCENVSVIPTTLTTYCVRISGLVEGDPSEIDNVPIHISVTTSGNPDAPMTLTADTTTNSSGHYTVEVCTFSVCNGTGGTITVSSSAFPGTTQCPYMTEKYCK